MVDNKVFTPEMGLELYKALCKLFEQCTMIHTHWGEDCNQKQADAAKAKAKELMAKIAAKM